MRTMRFLVGAGFAALTLCAPAMAQDAPPPPGARVGGPGMHHRGMMEHRAPIARADVEKMVAERFAMLDTNHDGVVTRAELDGARDKRHADMRAKMEARIKERRGAMFDRLDANHDGTISREEFAAAMPPHGGHGGLHGDGHDRMAGPGPAGGERMERFAMRDRMHGPRGGPEHMLGGRWFDLVVDDHGGKVTLAEVKKGALTLFDRLDLNHDGTISPDERRMAFRGMRWRGGFGPDHGGMAQPAKG